MISSKTLNPTLLSQMAISYPSTIRSKHERQYYKSLKETEAAIAELRTGEELQQTAACRSYPNQGKVPEYLKQAAKEVYRRQTYRHGMVMVEEQERAGKEAVLRSKHAELMQILASQPFSESEGTKRRRRMCER